MVKTLIVLSEIFEIFLLSSPKGFEIIREKYFSFNYLTLSKCVLLIYNKQRKERENYVPRLTLFVIYSIFIIH